MKNPIFALPLLIVALATTSFAQAKSVAVANHQTTSKPGATSQNPANSTRARVLRQDSAAPLPSASAGNGPETPKPTAKVDFNNHTELSRVRRTNQPAETVSRGSAVKSVNEKSVDSAKSAGSPSNSTAAPAATNPFLAATQVYRIGPNDVLDIQLAGNNSRKSTLFTVLNGGLLEYPLAGNPLPVVGMTTSELAKVLRQRIKIFENPLVVVNVRDYASHTVSITGFVAAPGTKALRREAVPLYAVLAEVVALPEAARATISRQGRPTMTLDLKDPNHSATLVVPGDVIKVLGAPPPPTEFFFVGEGLNSPGQKPYHSGLTLTQAILASGGIRTSAGSRIRISRQRADGRLANEDFDLRKIQSGKIPDPDLQKGDRVEVIGN
jgi:protein involved in polysaccharide export with SLBB domain